MSENNDRPDQLRQRAAREKQRIDSFWSGSAGLYTILTVGVAAVLGVLVAFGVL
ncbi:hypothetical protein [Curtobacterium sp. 20TX0008]|uniref:hypothetical protein n=1 Tax=Curtobacterium sp. 20TX0008 TaxID=3022018 RepID=UPI0023302D1D|nr:hypothetical protein [Curtobacterium sp. 20TX0008]MDB6425893.1 hypothetical protein [Curtobacterium sp. 20TX0008]